MTPNPTTVQIMSTGRGSCRRCSGASRGRKLKVLILRLTPRGLVRPRLLTQRPRAISLSSASRQAGSRSGGNGGCLGQLALDHAHGVREAQAVWIEPARPGRLRH